jgi:hypothetical protein
VPGRGRSLGGIGVANVANQETQAERVTGRIGVHLEVVSLGRTSSWLEDSGTEVRHVCVGDLEVLDPQVEVDLLMWCAVRLLRRDVVWCVLHPDAWFAIDDHHVPAVVTVDLTAEHPSPKALSASTSAASKATT